ncbi:hypothetical protein NMG60_11013498 [Bertholletia excelsa]
MSWHTYADEHLMRDIEGNQLSSAAIVGHDGSVWAESHSFPRFNSQEIAEIMRLHLGGIIHGHPRWPGAVIRAKKGSGVAVVKKTGQALIFGIYEEPVTPGQCNMVVERLGDYLIEQDL